VFVYYSGSERRQRLIYCLNSSLTHTTALSQSYSIKEAARIKLFIPQKELVEVTDTNLVHLIRRVSINIIQFDDQYLVKCSPVEGDRENDPSKEGW